MFKDPTFLIIGDLSLYWHGLLMSAALALGMLLSFSLYKKQHSGNRLRDILMTFIIALPFAFLFARAYYCWCQPENFSGFTQLFNFGNGGYGLLGGIAGAAIGIAAASFILHRNTGELLDACAPGIGLSIAIGRWCAVFTGENLGGVVTAEFFQNMPFAMYSEGEGMYRKAFFAACSVITLIITIAVAWLFEQRYVKNTITNRSGDIFMLFISLYFMLQGIFEQYRFDPLYFNTPYIQKLQTVSATFSLGALLGAVPLAIMILRNLIKKGIKLKYLWQIPACGLLFFGYFNIVLRVDAVSEALNGAVLVVSALGLAFVAVQLFIDSAEFDNSLFKPVRSKDLFPDNWYHGEAFQPGRNARRNNFGR